MFRISNKRPILVLIIILLIGVQPFFAQSEDPVIGVALSGGGAKGLAHIGFLQALEESGIEVDLITGVSMGSIVGGMYAAGYHPDIIAQEFRKMDYNLLLSDDISEERVIYDEKDYFRRKLLTFTFKNGEFISPGGLIQGQYITSLMDYYSWPVHKEKDFSKFPIPYKTVATNVEKIEATLFESGNLSEVMRASMAVPLAFSPVEIDSSLYVDGGVLRNFAVEELRDMGADIIIGSYTGGKMIAKDKLKSAPFISAQLMSFSGLFDSENQKEDVDLLIGYDFGNLGGTDFQAYDSLINLGYETALAYMDEFKSIAKKQRSIKKKKRRVPKMELLSIDSIEVEGNIIHSDDYIIRELGLRPGYVVTPQLMKERMTELYGLFLFDRINYEVNVEGGKNILTIKCIEKSRNWMNLSIHYDNHYDFGINLDYINRNLLLQNTRFTFSAYLSQYFRFQSKYELKFGNNNRWKASLGLRLNRDHLPSLFINESFEQFNTLDFSGDLNFYYQLSANSKIGTGIQFESINTYPNILDPESWSRFNIKNANIGLYYKLNDLDNYYFPSKGKEVGLSLKNINLVSALYDFDFGNDDVKIENDFEDYFSQFALMLKSRFYFPLSKRISLSARLNAIASLGEAKTDNNYALVGGYFYHNERALPFMGFNTNEFVVKNALGGGLGIKYKISRNWESGIYFDSYMLEDINTKKIDPFYGGGIELGFKSIIGPVKLGLVHGIYSNRRVFNGTKYYISIGHLLN